MKKSKQDLRYKIYVINLKRRPDRLKAVLTQIKPEWLQHTIFTTNWPGPVDGCRIHSNRDLKEAGLSLYPNWKIPGYPGQYWEREMTKGEIGCSYSHLCVWRAAQKAFSGDPELKYVLVLEDDVKFIEDPIQSMDEILHVIDKDWDLLYLSRAPLYPEYEQNPIGRLIKPDFSYCTLAYALSRKGVEKLLSARFEDAIIPVDEFLPACYCEHDREDIRKVYPPILNAWAFHLKIATMIDGSSKIDSDTENSGHIEMGNNN